MNSDFEGPIVRDYLYVDLGRVRSLLSQLVDGAPESVTDRSERIASLSAQLRLGPLGGVEGARSKGSSADERRSLTDLHFALLEETAEAFGLLTDVTNDVRQREKWHAGEVSALLEPAQMFRVTAPIRMVDPVHFKESLDRVDALVDAVVPMVQNASSNRSPVQRTGGANAQAKMGAKQRAAAKEEMLGGLPVDALASIGSLVESLLAGGISVRSMPCGTDSPECAFTGVLLDRSDYIEPERSVIFSRYGSHAGEWTLVGLVARHGKPEEVGPALVGAALDQLGIENLAIGLLDKLSEIGATGAPAFPSISVVPLALYRVLPRMASR